MTVKIDKARKLAQQAHHGQTDKLSVDYMEHVEAVTASVAHLGEDYTIAALLHDTVEDCEDTELVNLPLIARIFGQRIGDAVECITKRPFEKYPAYLNRVSSNQIACAVKRADLAHNQSRLALLPDPLMRSRLREKYAFASEIIEKANKG